MLSLVPILTWLPAVVSGALLAVLFSMGEISGPGGWLMIAWFVVAVWLQLHGAGLAFAIGLALQALLAVTLLVKMRLNV